MPSKRVPSVGRITLVDLVENRGLHGQFPSIIDRIRVEGDCWIWTGSKDGGGYGRVTVRNELWLVHRIVWTALVDEIATDMELASRCRRKECCNPDHHFEATHLEMVQNGYSHKFGPRVDNRRRTHCKRGHPFSGANLVKRLDGRRGCRTCKNASDRRTHRKAEPDAQ